MMDFILKAGLVCSPNTFHLTLFNRETENCIHELYCRERFNLFFP